MRLACLEDFRRHRFELAVINNVSGDSRSVVDTEALIDVSEVTLSDTQKPAETMTNSIGQEPAHADSTKKQDESEIVEPDDTVFEAF